MSSSYGPVGRSAYPGDWFPAPRYDADAVDAGLFGAGPRVELLGGVPVDLREAPGRLRPVRTGDGAAALRMDLEETSRALADRTDKFLISVDGGDWLEVKPTRRATRWLLPPPPRSPALVKPRTGALHALERKLWLGFEPARGLHPQWYLLRERPRLGGWGARVLERYRNGKPRVVTFVPWREPESEAPVYAPGTQPEDIVLPASGEEKPVPPRPPKPERLRAMAGVAARVRACSWDPATLPVGGLFGRGDKLFGDMSDEPRRIVADLTIVEARRGGRDLLPSAGVRERRVREGTDGLRLDLPELARALAGSDEPFEVSVMGSPWVEVSPADAGPWPIPPAEGARRGRLPRIRLARDGDAWYLLRERRRFDQGDFLGLEHHVKMVPWNPPSTWLLERTSGLPAGPERRA
jgi:hypothetical protein